MEKRQGIKARAEAHRKSVAIDEDINHLDETNYIPTESSILEEYQEKYSDEPEVIELHNDGKARYKGSEKPKKKSKGCITFIIGTLLVAAAVGAVGYKIYQDKYGLSKEVMDVNEYYGSLDSDERMFIIFNQEQREDYGIQRDGMQYLPYDLVNDHINPKIYWDYNDELLLYSYSDQTETIDLTQDLEDDSDYTVPVAVEQDETLYISTEYIMAHTDIHMEAYQEPNRIVVRNDWEGTQIVTVKKDTQIRYRGGVKSDILRELTGDEELILLEAGEEWHLVMTEDGFRGYVQAKMLKDAKDEIREQTFEEETYSHTLEDYKINLGWHQTTNITSNQNIDTILDGTQGTLTTIAPTWFFIDDTLGTVTSLATQAYVDIAHERGVDVWATLNDFDGNIGSQVETYHVLNSTQKRTKIIEQVMDEVLKYGIDGINVDIELVSVDTGNHFIQFIRELSIECRKHGIILSVDNYPPKSYNSHYEWAEQGEVVDYVIIMGYDEYYGGSKQAGPVSSITYTEEGIAEMLNHVPAEQLINAVPFYSRIWEEVEKSDEEKAEDAGTDNEQYDTKVTSSSYGMAGAKAKAEQGGAVISWDYYTKHNFGTWTSGSKTYKVWFEDVDSLREKLAIMETYNIAGVAAWKLGIEEPEVWDLVKQYLEK